MRLLEVFLLMELNDRLNYIAKNMQKKISHKWDQRLLPDIKANGARGLPRAWKKVIFDVLAPDYDANGLQGDSEGITDEQIKKRSKWIVEWFAQYDPTKNKKYTDWLIRQWIDGRLLLEDVSSAKRVLVTFEEHKKTLKKLDLSEYDVDTAPESPNIPSPERRGDLNSWKDYRLLAAVMRPLTGTQPAGEKVSNFLKKPEIQDYINHPVPDPVKAFGHDGEFDFDDLRSNYVDEDGVDNFDTMDWYNGFTSKPDDIATTAIKPIYKSDRLAVLQPNTKAASCELGKGTEWCTAYTEADNEFWTYAPDGPLYVILTDKMGKFQFHFDSGQFANIHDDMLGDDEKKKLVSAYPELKQLFADEALEYDHEWLIDPSAWTPERAEKYMSTHDEPHQLMNRLREWDGIAPEETLQYLEKVARTTANAWAYLRNPTEDDYKDGIVKHVEEDSTRSIPVIVRSAFDNNINLDDKILGIAADANGRTIINIPAERLLATPELVMKTLADKRRGQEIFHDVVKVIGGKDRALPYPGMLSTEQANAVMHVIENHPQGQQILDRYSSYEDVVAYGGMFGTEPWMKAYSDAQTHSEPNTAMSDMGAQIAGSANSGDPIDLDYSKLATHLLNNDILDLLTFKCIEVAMGGELPVEIQQELFKVRPDILLQLEKPHNRLRYLARKNIQDKDNEYQAGVKKSWDAKQAAANESITEGVSSILYHVSSIHNIRDMLTDNSIRLTPNFGTGAERGHEPEGKIYYLSTARSKTGSYGYPVSNSQKQGAMVVFDGQALMAAGYTGKAMDYWGPEFRALGKDEMEDRIFSKKPAIPKASKYIKEIHILFATDETDNRTPLVARVLKDLGYKAKRLNIPLYVYTDQQAFSLLNKNKSRQVTSVDSTADKLPLPDTDIEPRGYRGGPTRNYFGGWIELLRVKDRNQLSKAGKDALNRAHYFDANQGVDADIHNARTNKQRPHLDKFLAVLQQFKINSTTELMTYVNNKFN